MMTKRLIREIIMQLLFQWEMQGIIEKKNEINIKKFSDENLKIVLSQFISNFYTKDQAKINIEQITKLLQDILENLIEIDKIIEKHMTNWQLSRLNAIDRAILRLAAFELCIEKKLSVQIVINEAIEIAKRFGSEHSSSFINGVLDALNSEQKNSVIKV